MSRQGQRRVVGILGGMGPEATVLLMSRVIALTCAEDDKDHVPMMVDSNTQVPSRIRALIEKDGSDPGPILCEMARRLEAQGAKALAMPCNTAHHYSSVIKQAAGIPFIDMVELSVSRVHQSRRSNQRVGVLGSPAIKLTQLFDSAFASHEIETLYPQDQDQMLQAIRLVKKDSTDRTARRIVQAAAEELDGGGAGSLLIACSELSMISDAIPPGFEFLDTIEILAEAIIEFSGARCHTNPKDCSG